jgi:hypothetical protein
MGSKGLNRTSVPRARVIAHLTRAARLAINHIFDFRDERTPDYTIAHLRDVIEHAQGYINGLEVEARDRIASQDQDHGAGGAPQT